MGGRVGKGIDQFLRVRYAEARLLGEYVDLGACLHCGHDEDVSNDLEQGSFASFFTAKVNNRLGNAGICSVMPLNW